MNAMDFDDLLVNSVRLLERFQEVHDHYAQTFRWVMVDETRTRTGSSTAGSSS